MISDSRIDNIYEKYLNLYEKFSMLEDLTSIESKAFLKRVLKEEPGEEQYTDEQIAYHFLDTYNRTEKLNAAVGRLMSAPQWYMQEFNKNIQDYIDNYDYQIRNRYAPSKELLLEVQNDIQTLKDIRYKAVNDPQYRKAFVELFLAGTSNNQALLKSILSPTGFEE